MTIRRRLVLFTRFPEPGRVKTRLIPALGEEGATALHRRLVVHTLRTAETACDLCAADLEIRFEGGSEDAMQYWLGDRLHCRPQGDGDLGGRMARAIEESFVAGAQATIIIGSDSPGLSPDLIKIGFEELTSNSVVLGPAADGGYYLVGVTQSVPELFRNISWGTDRVLGESLKILASANTNPALLRTLEDIDRPEDLPVWDRVAEAEDVDHQGVSVIIPALNESRVIVSTLESVRQSNPLETFVVDGGSADGTADVALKAGATVFRSKAGRARQMNAGAAKARGSLLLFLHADTILPAGWTSEVSRIFHDHQVKAGAFAFRVAENFRGKRMLERTVNWRARRFQLPYGDQGLFLRRAIFEGMGGFANLPVMEDYELVCRLRRLGQIVISSLPATTSGRRWSRLGLLRVTLKNQLMIAGFRLGVSPETLARFYRGRSNSR